MSQRKRPWTTLWVTPDTRNLVNKKKRKGETQDGFLRRILQ